MVQETGEVGCKLEQLVVGVHRRRCHGDVEMPFAPVDKETVAPIGAVVEKPGAESCAHCHNDVAVAVHDGGQAPRTVVSVERPSSGDVLLHRRPEGEVVGVQRHLRRGTRPL